jgi:hypothetical protein
MGTLRNQMTEAMKLRGFSPEPNNPIWPRSQPWPGITAPAGPTRL